MSVSRYVTQYIPIIVRYGGLSRHPLLRKRNKHLCYKIAKRVYFSKEYNFCYFRMPKAASTTILNSLSKSILKKDKSMIELEKKFQKLPNTKDLNNVFKFTFVRNPVTRVLSAYLDKSRDPSFLKSHTFLNVAPGTIQGFEHFLACLEDGKLLSNLHWAPQTEILPFEVEEIDFVGRFEKLEDDLRFCLENIAGGDISIESSRPHQTDADNRIREYISKHSRSTIERLYSKDFEIFYP